MSETEEKKRKPGQRGPDKGPRKKKARDLPPAGDEGAPPPKPRSAVASELRLIAGEYLVTIFWGISWAVTWALGGKLAQLERGELREGAERAQPLLERWPIVASVLSFAGLPVWLVRKVAEKVTFPKKAPPPATQTAPTGQAAGASFTPKAPEPEDTGPGPTAEELAAPPDNVRPLQPRG